MWWGVRLISGWGRIPTLAAIARVIVARLLYETAYLLWEFPLSATVQPNFTTFESYICVLSNTSGPIITRMPGHKFITGQYKFCLLPESCTDIAEGKFAPHCHAPISIRFSQEQEEAEKKL